MSVSVMMPITFSSFSTGSAPIRRWRSRRAASAVGAALSAHASPTSPSGSTIGRLRKAASLCRFQVWLTYSSAPRHTQVLMEQLTT